MAQVILTREINASADEVWASWDDFANIDQYNPNLSQSFLLGDQPTGMGATRQCDMQDGKNYIQERIIRYVPGKRMTIDIYDGTMPLKRAEADIRLRPLTADRTELQFIMRFTPSMGVIGLLMVPLMKPQFRKLLGKLVDANKAYVERGEQVKRPA